MARKSRIILHGKQGANQEVRDAVAAVREDGHEIEVRVPWEAGDSGLFAAQAAEEGVDTVIAGGGHVLCPDAVLNDGLLDVGILPDVPEDQQAKAIGALMSKGLQAVKDAALYQRVPWVEVDAPKGLYVNLDGEPTHATHHRFDIEADRLKLHLPESTELLSS